MKLVCKRSERTCADGALSFKLMAVMNGIFVAMAFTLEANDPGWWSSPGTGSQGAVVAPVVTTNMGVVTTNYIPNDYAVVIQGQLKQFTVRAVDQMNTNLPGGAGWDLTTMASNWAAEYSTNGYSATNHEPSDYQAMNVGQLKYIGAKVWTQLLSAGYTNYPPSWLVVDTNTDNAVANIGQLKEVFNFDLTLDTDSNGLPDWWEMYYFGQLGNTATNQSPAGDGYTILYEYQHKRNPFDYYQGVAPVLAIVSGNNQTNFSGAFLTNALVVSVTDASSNPLTNAPVTFWVSTGKGLVSTSNTGTPAPVSYQQLRTGTSGYAQVYFQQPLVANSTNAVSVAAGGSTVVNFTARTSPDTGTPAAPTGITAMPGGAGEINLTWVNHADNATYILVKQSTDLTTWTTIATLSDPTVTSYTASGLTQGQGYYFGVEAGN